MCLAMFAHVIHGTLLNLQPVMLSAEITFENPMHIYYKGQKVPGKPFQIFEKLSKLMATKA